MTNASKTLPNWHWYAMEHVANEGRCDYIGCNDSFGFQVPNEAKNGANFGSHYIPPRITFNNDKVSGNDAIFVRGETYLPAATGEQPSAGLLNLFKAFGIGTGEATTEPDQIAKGDPAWLNYRLKGTQTRFTTSTGVPTGMGASITEGGFVNSASCLSCHAQASTDANGNVGMQGVGSGWRPNLDGLTQVQMGAPRMNDFYALGGPSISATQIDFVWGILSAQCIAPSGNEGCKSYAVPVPE